MDNKIGLDASQDKVNLNPEDANDEILKWNFKEVPNYLVYSRRMKMKNPQYILENLNLTGVVHSHSGWRWTKRSQHNGFEYQIDIFENCKFVKEGQEVNVLWNDEEPSIKKYRVEMKPIKMTKGIIDSLYSIDIQYYKYNFCNTYGNYIFNYKKDLISNINELSEVVNDKCESYVINSCDYIRINDLQRIRDFVENLIEIKNSG